MAHVLVVDDDTRLVEMLRRTLSYEGFTVSVAQSGDEALRLVSERRPDVVVLDWLLPGLDGLAVVQRLRAGGGRDADPHADGPRRGRGSGARAGQWG